MPRRFDPDQARHCVVPDLGSICLQRYELTTLGGNGLKLIEKSDEGIEASCRVF